MTDYIETTAGKFTFRIATDRLYTPQGVWIFWVEPQQDNRFRIGLADYLQRHSGDIAFASVKPPGTKLSAGDDFAEIETVKVLLVLPSPLSGTVAEVNPALEDTPEIVNQDPYDKGWLAVIDASNWEEERATLLEPRAYLSVMQSQIEEELK